MPAPTEFLSRVVLRLPSHLQQRSRILKDSAEGNRTGTVIYWMRTALRTEENPALDVARWLAQHLGLPLLVYQGLSQRYRYASDRHHTFILEGARDVQARFANQGVSYAFHLERPGHDGPVLRELAQSAAVLVTEDMPTGPARYFLRALQEHTNTPLLAVDTACVVPMQCVGRAYERAFRFRAATQNERDARIALPWPQIDATPAPFDLETLAFTPVDLRHADLADLVAECDIDHAVGAVLGTTGGMNAAEERWLQFKAKGLQPYARLRNDAARDGVSRMSPYNHYGMISTFRLAREASRFDHDGAKKYVDELVTWRELAYTYCFYRADHDPWDGLPAWAQQTLEEHAVDTRDHELTWEELARGKSGDELWDAAQTSLLLHGELHNNLRMTWGKALLGWTPSPREALRLLIDLNHRYALDGRDPASYGGLLWCLGAFDRPFSPPRPITGTVRPRPTALHRDRLDMPAYIARACTPRHVGPLRVAVVGAGLSGAFAARTLADHGLEVEVFDKSRGLGGRMATRRSADGTLTFDHGAQYFTVRDRRFARLVASWSEQGLVAEWDGRIAVVRDGTTRPDSRSVERWVGVPTMTAISKHLTAELRVTLNTRITHIVRDDKSYQLLDDDNGSHGPFDRVVVAMPAPQAADLLGLDRALSARLRDFAMRPCWALMVAFDTALGVAWDGAFIHDAPISWAARGASKPRRSSQESWVVHASAAWSEDHLDASREYVASQLLDAFWEAANVAPQAPTVTMTHRWMYAIPAETSAAGCLVSDDRRLVACGDWAHRPRVEGAFLSSHAAAGRILATREPIGTSRS